MVVGEVANFAAYAFAPAILVTPLGALSIIISALLADVMLNEKLNVFGWVGCGLCINGSVTIVLHAPAERQLNSVLEVWQMAMQPGESSLGVSLLSWLGCRFAAVGGSYLQPQQLVARAARPTLNTRGTPPPT
jgi:hypothetical protein